MTKSTQTTSGHANTCNDGFIKEADSNSKAFKVDTALAGEPMAVVVVVVVVVQEIIQKVKQRKQRTSD